jgi:hypothetical protein
MRCFTECMTGLELRYSELTQVMSVPSRNYNFAGFREGVGFFYTQKGEGNTTAKAVTRGGGSEFQVAA